MLGRIACAICIICTLGPQEYVLAKKKADLKTKLPGTSNIHLLVVVSIG